MPKEYINMIDEDIRKIDAVLESAPEEQWELFRELDGHYQACIKDFYKGLWESSHSGAILYFPQLKAKPEYLVENLKIVKAKLQTYRFGMNAISLPAAQSTNVNVTTNVNVNITFDQVRSQVEDMTSLTDEQTQEILDKIDEIEKVVNSTDKKKTKWEKLKPTLAWLADKSCDVGIALLPLLLKI